MGLAVKPKELIKFLENNGWKFIRANGTSHHIYGKDGKTIPVPIHAKDVKTGTLFSIIKKAGLSKSELEKWLGR